MHRVNDALYVAERRLPISPLNDAYLVLEAPQSRVALDTALRRTIGHRPLDDPGVPRPRASSRRPVKHTHTRPMAYGAP